MDKRLKKGDTVRILPFEEIMALTAGTRTMPSGTVFVNDMDQYCGREFVIRSVAQDYYYLLTGTASWWFTEEMFDVEKFDKPIDYSFDALFSGELI